MLGDLNIDFLKVNNSHEIHRIMNNYGRTNIIHEPTRSTHNTNTLIDPIIMNENICIHDSGTLSVCNVLSDHRATYIYIHQKTNTNMAYKRKILDYKHADMELLNKLILECDWCRIIDDTDNIDKATTNLLTNSFLLFINAYLKKL